MSTSDEYFKRYDMLKSLLVEAYINIYAIEEIDRYNHSIITEKMALTKSSLGILSHICDLLKSDLGNIIWKLYYDQDSDTNTIKHLNTFIYKNYANSIGTIRMPKMSLSDNLKNVGNELIILRNNFLSHNATDRSGISIQIDDLKTIVEELKNKLNGLCLPTVDARVTPITNQQLQALKLDVSFGLGIMINQSTFPVI